MAMAMPIRVRAAPAKPAIRGTKRTDRAFPVDLIEWPLTAQFFFEMIITCETFRKPSQSPAVGAYIE
jgi:hypothetical protein